MTDLETPKANSKAESKAFREVRLWIRNRATLDLIASAKLDAFFILGHHALVIDTKSGFNEPTPSEANWQLRCQTIALWQNYPDLIHIRAATAHSRLSSKLDTTDYHLEDLQRIERELLHILWRANQPDAPRIPGSHCRWCRALGTCPEAATWSMVPSRNAAALPNGKPDQFAILQAVSRLAPDQLAFVHERRSIADAMFEAVEARMKQLPAEQLAEIGYKLVPGNQNKEITDVATAFARLAPLLKNGEHDDRMQCIKFMRGQAAELLADRRNISKKVAQEQVDAAIGDALRDKPGNARLKAV